MLTAGKRLEQGGQLSEAAAVYQKMVDGESDNQEAVERLLVVYRKLKEYGKELAVIDAVLKGYEQQNKASQEKWIKEHPKAAGMGKAIFRQLGGTGASGLGTDAAVNRLLKRKMFVQKRIAAGKGKKGGKGAAGTSKTSNSGARAGGRQKGLEIVARKKMATQQRRKEAEERKKAAVEQRRKEAQEKKEAAAAARKQAIEQRRQQAAADKAEKHLSLFVISLRYLAPLEKIDAAMARHTAFLDRHYKKGDFLVSGRQVPRTGGIIIARGKDRNAVERMMKQDPFVKQRLASVDVVEFSASRVGKGWNEWVSGAGS